MIRIYQECYPGALLTEHGRSLCCLAEWIETSAENLLNTVTAIEQIPRVLPPIERIQLEIDGIMVEIDRLPKEGPGLLKRCSYWLDDFRRAQTRSTIPSPVFGL